MFSITKFIDIPQVSSHILTLTCHIFSLLLISLNQLLYIVHGNQENQSAEVTFILLGFSEYLDSSCHSFWSSSPSTQSLCRGTWAWSWLLSSIPDSTSPHVLLPQPPVLCWFLLFHSHYTQTIRKLGCGEQNYLLHWMHHAVLLCMHIYGDRNIHVGSDGLWLICGSFQSSFLIVVMSKKFYSLLVGASYSWGIAYSLPLNFCWNCPSEGIIPKQLCLLACHHCYCFLLLPLPQPTDHHSPSHIQRNKQPNDCFTSYVFIFITAMKMTSIGGGHKTFSTCASHMTAITIFHGTIIFLYYCS